MDLIKILLLIASCLCIGLSMVGLIISLRALTYSGGCSRATGMWSRVWHAGLIRYGQNVPNNGTLYRSMHNRRDEVTWEERQAWIDDNRELYYDILDQKNVCGKYAIGRGK